MVGEQTLGNEPLGVWRQHRVRGVFRSPLKSSIRPIQIGRKLIRSIDSGRTTSADGKSVSPNQFTVILCETDRTALGDLEKALIAELTDAAKQYASDEGFSLSGEVSVSIVTDATLKPGKFEVRAEIKAGTRAEVGLSGSTPSSLREAERSSEVSPAPAASPVAGVPNVPVSPAPAPPVVPAPVAPPTVATPSIPPVPAPSAAPPAPEKKAVLVLGDGTKVAVKPGVLSIGRSAESSVPLNDTNVSRRHAEIRSRGEGARIEWYLVDVGSTNGTMLNGVKISGEQKLKKGDALMFGGTAARFEVS